MFVYGPSTNVKSHTSNRPAAERDAAALTCVWKSTTPGQSAKLTSATNTVTTADAESPESSVTVNVTGYSPRPPKTRVTNAPDADHPDPSDHS